MTTHKEALFEIVKTKKGKKSDLTNKIGAKYVRDFELIGYIRTGYSDNNIELWGVTKFAEGTWNDVYSKVSIFEGIIGFFFSRILRVN